MARGTKKQSKAGLSENSSVAQREQYWRGQMRRWERSGLTQAEFCRGESLALSAFRWWRAELKRREGRLAGRRSPQVKGNRSSRRKPNAFVPVEVIEATAQETQGGSLEVVLRGNRRIVVGAQFDPTAVEQLVALLERVPC